MRVSVPSSPSSSLFSLYCFYFPLPPPSPSTLSPSTSNLTPQGRRDHICESCPMRFFNRGGLLRHQRTVHEQRKDFSCRFCGKKFGEKRNMESHERIHTGEKKFKCPHCEYACVDKSNLTKHLKKHATPPPNAPVAQAPVHAETENQVVEARQLNSTLNSINPVIQTHALSTIQTSPENTPKMIIHSGTPLQFANQQILIPQDAILASISAAGHDIPEGHVRVHMHGSTDAFTVVPS